MYEMTPQEIAEILLETANDASTHVAEGNYTDLAADEKLYGALCVGANYLSKIASGEYAPVVHVKPRKISPQAPGAMFETICPKCGSMGFASDEYCAMCGAVLDGKDDSHETD